MRLWICCKVKVKKISITLFTVIIIMSFLFLAVDFHSRYLTQTDFYQWLHNRLRFGAHPPQSSKVHHLQRNRSTEQHSPQSCQPKTNVMFLKTHKTASSTVLNLLYRFGEKHNLTFALPIKYLLDYPKFFSSRSVKGFPLQDGQHYNIMCNHMRFNRPEVQKVMPADTFYFSILRNPVTMAESSYSYFKFLAPSFNRSASFEDFIADPWQYYVPHLRYNHLARNLLWFDFGFDHNANFSLQSAQAGVAEIQQSFHLILLAEYFDQSMVLLRDALCWSLDDIVTFRLNFRSNETQWRLSPAQEDRLKVWNAMDWYLYQTFNKTFWQKVESFGKSRMDQEVASLQARREELTNLCLLKGGKPVDASQILDEAVQPYQSGQADILGYNLNLNLSLPDKERCLRMIMPEQQHKDLLDSKQFPSTEAVQKQTVANGVSRLQEKVQEAIKETMSSRNRTSPTRSSLDTPGTP
ncbi:galactose-3-O-sulfotransferase 2-like [Polypterus senegalus]|nr:galactose-3-O-sulfotransferase 2-like [Polypterus senegalus]